MKLAIFSNNGRTAVFTLLAAIVISTSTYAKDSDDGAFKLFINDAQTVEDGGTAILGRVDAGSVSVGDTVCVPLNTGDSVSQTVAAIEEFSKKLETATKGKMVKILVIGVNSDDVATDHYLNSDC